MRRMSKEYAMTSKRKAYRRTVDGGVKPIKIYKFIKRASL